MSKIRLYAAAAPSSPARRGAPFSFSALILQETAFERQHVGILRAVELPVMEALHGAVGRPGAGERQNRPVLQRLVVGEGGEMAARQIEGGNPLRLPDQLLHLGDRLRRARFHPIAPKLASRSYARTPRDGKSRKKNRRPKAAASLGGGRRREGGPVRRKRPCRSSRAPFVRNLTIRGAALREAWFSKSRIPREE